MLEEFCSLEELALQDPLGVRNQRTLDQGITMIIDKGLGVRQFQDLLDTAGEYIDFIKLGFGTTVLYPASVLKEKLLIAKRHGITVYPGGTFFEVAFHQNKTKDYLFAMKSLGFSKVEISDGTVELPSNQRLEAVKQARAIGLSVITECGKKAAGSTIHSDELIQTLLSDLNAGSSYVIVEGRESGENVGIYDEKGKIQDEFALLMEQIQPYTMQVIWEAPKKDQQVELMKWFGPNVNLGNIQPDDIYSVESLRRGLRSDTFFWGNREGKQ